MGYLTVFALAFETATLGAAPSCAGNDYAEAVARYRSGDYPGALSTFEALGRPVEPDAAETEDACIATLSLLDTELGAMHAAESRWTAARAYLEAAWQTSARIRDARQRTLFQRHWLLYVGLLHQDLIFSGERAGAVSGAETYLTWAAERYPEDPEVLLAAGAFVEWASSVGLRHSAREAEALYIDALRADPTLAAAHVRIGWVRSFQLDAHALAGASFMEGLSLATEPILIYRARMGLGRLAERRGRWKDAARQYEEAIRVAPGWQVGHTALAYALHRAGARTRAREVLAASARIPDEDDNLLGWWSYELGSSPSGDRILEELRTEAVRR